MVVSAPPAQAASKRLSLGFTDPVFLSGIQAADWFARVPETGGDVIRLDALWSSIAPTKPETPTSPDDPAYRWSSLDLGVKQATAAGLTVVIMIETAPAWAEGEDRPRSARAGTWDPDVQAFGELAEALASRYSGSHPDPAVPGALLPAVRIYQAWNEPNLNYHLAPQWKQGARRPVQASPTKYRAMLNSFYSGIKTVQPSATVVAAGASPFGDPVAGGERLAPAAFWRDVFCFTSANLNKRTRCNEPAKFDIFDHHPYSVGGPRRKALNPDDVSIPDLAKLTRPLRAAEKQGTALPRKRHRIWVTEVSWDSSPPDPDGVPESKRARWIARTFETLWRQGVDTILWYGIRDADPVPSFAATYQSGMYLNDGTPKLGQQAFRFPVVVTRDGRRASVWVRSPVAGVVSFELRGASGKWRSFFSARVGAGDVRRKQFSVPRDARLRARLTTSR